MLRARTRGTLRGDVGAKLRLKKGPGSSSIQHSLHAKLASTPSLRFLNLCLRVVIIEKQK